MSNTAYYLQGRQGGILLTLDSTNEQGAGPFRWLQFVNDTILSSVDDNTISDIGSIVGLAIPAGVGIGGSFTDVAVTSGAVIAYYA